MKMDFSKPPTFTPQLGMVVAGAVLLIVGLFLPIWKVVSADYSLMDDGSLGTMLAVIVLVIVSVPFIWNTNYAMLLRIGGVALIVLVVHFLNVNSFPGSELNILGWIVLIAGALLLLAPGAMTMMESRNKA